MMPGAAPTTGWPRAATLIAAVAAGIVLGVVGAVAESAFSDRPEPDLVLPGLRVQAVADGDDLGRVRADLAISNVGAADFHVADVRVPGWTLADPDAVRTVAPVGGWTHLSFDLIADCSPTTLDPEIEIVGADGAAVVLERDAAGRGLVSAHQQACIARDTAPGAIPAVATTTARPDVTGGVVHIDVGVGLEAGSELDLEFAAVTGHASGFTVELPDQINALAAGETTTVTTDWRVRDCGGAAGTTGAGEPDLSGSGNFAGLVLHLYWDDPAGSDPIRTDLAVDLPTEVIATLARFAVAECGAVDAET